MINSTMLRKVIPKLIYGISLRNSTLPAQFSCYNQCVFQETREIIKKHEYVQHIQTRSYAKSKDKGGKDKKNQGKTEINLNQLSTLIDVNGFQNNLQKVLDSLQDSFVQHLTIRSSSGSIETLSVSFEGKKYELQELAQVVRKNPKTVVLNMATFPQAIPAVLSAINASGLNLNPQQDGTTVFIPIAKVTKEHREHLAKNAKTIYTSSTSRIKDVQIDQFKKMKKMTGISEDLVSSVNKQILAITSQYLDKAKIMYKTKHDELTKSN